MTSDKSKKILTKREIQGLVISIILSLIFLYFAFTGIDINSLEENLKSASIFWIIIFIILNLAGHYVRVLRWKILLNPFKKETKINNLFGSLMVGYGFNSIFPRLGEIIRPVTLGNLEGISRTSVFGTIVVERIIDLIFMGLAVIGSAYLVAGNIYISLPWLKPTVYLGILFIVLAVIFLVILIKYREKFYNSYLRFIKKVSPANEERFGKFFNKILDGFATLTGFANYFSVGILSILIIFIYALTSYTGLFLFQMPESPHINFFTGWVISGISSIGIMIPTPGGIGSYHTITKATLVELYNFTPETSMTYAILTHGISYLTHIFAAIIYILMFRNKIALFKKNPLEILDEKG